RCAWWGWIQVVREVVRLGVSPWAHAVVGNSRPRRHRVRADLAGGVGGALSLDRVDHVVGRDLKLGERIRAQPHAHRILAGAEDLHLPDTLHAGHRIVDVDVGVVADEQLVVGALRRVHGEQGERTRSGLPDGHAHFLHLWWQLRRGLGRAHLRQHLVGARVGGDVEVDAQVHLAAVARARRIHVEHLRHTGHLLLDRRRHRFFKCERVGTDVRRLDEDLRWRDVRVEADGQLDERHRPQENHEDRDDDGDDWPVDEEPGHYARRGALDSEGGFAPLPNLPPCRLRGPSPRSEWNVKRLYVTTSGGRPCSAKRVFSNTYLVGVFPGAAGGVVVGWAGSVGGSAGTIVGATLSPVFTFSSPSTMTRWPGSSPLSTI